jgi:hypothetical protein
MLKNSEYVSLLLPSDNEKYFNKGIENIGL